MQFIVTLSWYNHRALVQRQADKSRTFKLVELIKEEKKKKEKKGAPDSILVSMWPKIVAAHIVS